MPLNGLIMDKPLMIASIIRHAARYHTHTEIVARTIEGGLFRYTYGEAHARICQLAHALGRLGMQPGDRVGALAWNTHRQFEMFYGVSGTGAVLHTVNPRLFPEQLVYIINHAEDRLLFVDAMTLPIVEKIAPQLTTVEACVMMADRAGMPASTTLPNLLCFEDLLAAEPASYDWPDFDERSASTICYTSGTTGNPKGVVYSHRSAILTCLLFGPLIGLRANNGDLPVMMPMAPMFHGNAWQFPYLAPMHGAKLVLPGRNYEPDKLYELLEGERCHPDLRRAHLLADPHRLAAAHRQDLQHAALFTVQRLGHAEIIDGDAGAQLWRGGAAGLGHDRGAGRQRRADAAARHAAQPGRTGAGPHDFRPCRLGRRLPAGRRCGR
jgi:acyl-CoA synthetase (AMP-forming)/AMP-acid ligase II